MLPKSILSFYSWKSGLNESLSSARERFLKPGLVDQETFDKLKDLDPTPTFKYLDKIISFYISGTTMDDIADVIPRFHTMSMKNQLKRTDINSYKKWEDLVSEITSSEYTYSKKQEFKASSKNADIVYENDDWIVLVPKTEEASCKYGAGTKWCVSAKENNMFNTYYKMWGVTIYMLLSKRLKPYNPETGTGDKDYKMAVSINERGYKECNDSIDDRISFEYVLEKSGLPESLFTHRKLENPITPDEFLDYLCEEGVLDKTKISKNSDGSIDYNGNVNLSGVILQQGFIIKFRNVNGYFNCSFNYLTSLEGAPENVKGDFYCQHNKLTSLKGGPEYVSGDFMCNENQLTSLEGGPREVGRDFHCNNNQLTNLEGAPTEVVRNFDCSNNQLTSLEGAPKKVKEDFHCYNNQLTSLEGAPESVGNSFYCNHNKLTSLKGGPMEVNRGNFYCQHNQLISLEGAPEYVGGSFYCNHNKLTSLKGGPKFVRTYFYCTNNQLISLEGAPESPNVGLDFSFNPNLPESEKQWAKKNYKWVEF